MHVLSTWCSSEEYQFLHYIYEEYRHFLCLSLLTHWSRDKMTEILQMILSSTSFFSNKILFLLQFSLKYVSLGLTDKSKFIHVKAWCHQPVIHCLIQCRLRPIKQSLGHNGLSGKFWLWRCMVLSRMPFLTSIGFDKHQCLPTKVTKGMTSSWHLLSKTSGMVTMWWLLRLTIIGKYKQSFNATFE